VGESNLVWEPSTGPDRLGVWRILVGPLPEEIDFVDNQFPDLDTDYSATTAVIEGDPNIRRLRLPSGRSDFDCLEIRGLAALEELVVECESPLDLDGTLQWIRVENCPLLRLIRIHAAVRRLEVIDNPVLLELDVSGCVNLDHLVLNKAVPGFKANIVGCTKLRGPSVGSNETLGFSVLAEQVARNQAGSRRDGLIYPEMTCVDIDQVSGLSNNGLKAMSRTGWLRSERSLLGRYGVLACDTQFKPLDYRILQPLEPVYTGGTGEAYAYVSIERIVNVDSLVIAEEEGAGNCTPEDCLDYMLQWLRAELSARQEIADSTNQELLAILASFADSQSNKIVIPPIRMSAFLDDRDRKKLLEILLVHGVTVEDSSAGDFAYVHPDAGIPNEEQTIRHAASVVVDLSSAIAQLHRLELGR
jgi:hypothetical protein